MDDITAPATHTAIAVKRVPFSLVSPCFSESTSDGLDGSPFSTSDDDGLSWSGLCVPSFRPALPPPALGEASAATVTIEDAPRSICVSPPPWSFWEASVARALMRDDCAVTSHHTEGWRHSGSRIVGEIKLRFS